MNMTFTPGMVERSGLQILTTHFGFLEQLKAALTAAGVAHTVGAGPAMIVVEFADDAAADRAWEIVEQVKSAMTAPEIPPRRTLADLAADRTLRPATGASVGMSFRSRTPDGHVLLGGDPETRAAQGAVDGYLASFLAPERVPLGPGGKVTLVAVCCMCLAPQTSAAAGGGFRLHAAQAPGGAEGECATCGWPGRAAHDLVDHRGKTMGRLTLALQYHPKHVVPADQEPERPSGIVLPGSET